jgi:hypothetical protein
MALTRYGTNVATIIKAPILSAATEPTLESGELCIFINTTTSKTFLLVHDGVSQKSVEVTA